MAAFHYAFKVKDLDSTRDFYLRILGCEAGRSSDMWLDFNFFGNQLTAHVSDNIPDLDFCGRVDGVHVPIPHFGCLLSVEVFETVQQKLEHAGIAFVVKPQKRYAGEVGEQRTMFVLDFSGNPIEFKAFSNQDEVFSK